MLKSNNTLKFWIFFTLLNLTLFLPTYLLHIQNTSFFPNFAGEPNFREGFKFFFRRDNLDIFRVSTDLLVVTWCLLFINSPNIRKKLKPFFIVLFILYFLYNFYQGVIHSIYQQWPLFYSDFLLMIEGLKLVMDNSMLWVVLILVLIVLSVFLIRLLFSCYFNQVAWKNISRGTLVVLIVFSLFSIGSAIDYKRNLREERLVFPINAVWIIDNIKRSKIVYDNTRNLKPDKYKSTYAYDKLALKKRPNLYIFFVESYGKIVVEDIELQSKYIPAMQNFEKDLYQEGWMSASAFSEAPTKGGKSWLGFTSMLMGVNVENHAIYEYLINHNDFEMPTIMGSLKAQDYKTYWLSPISDRRKDIPFDKYDKFYSIDERIVFKDLKYSGQLFGMLKSPPDQYALNFTKQYIDNQGVEPFVLFFISLNSHHPFVSPDHIVEDWQTLANRQDIVGSLKSEVKSNSKKEDYLSAIGYQFENLTDFIINQGKEEDIFIIIGDHQPPFLTNNKHSFETPLHIISKDSSFIEGFLGPMDRGMTTEKKLPHLMHSGIYSLFMRNFFNQYGLPDQNLPAFYPEGLPIDN